MITTGSAPKAIQPAGKPKRQRRRSGPKDGSGPNANCPLKNKKKGFSILPKVGGK